MIDSQRRVCQLLMSLARVARNVEEVEFEG